MKSRFLVGALLATALSFTTVSSDAGPPPGVGGQPAAGISVIVPLDPSIGQFPESITAADNGDIYLSMANIVWRATPDGSAPTPFATLPIPSGAFAMGLKFGRDGYLYAASASFDPSHDASHVWRISPQGHVTDYAHFDPNGFPNDIAFDKNGDLYVTDATFGVLYKVPAGGGSYSVWLDHPLLYGSTTNPLFQLRPFGADGLAFDASGKNLYVGNLDTGTIVKIATKHGAPTDVSVFASDTSLLGIDGLAFDASGNLYGAINVQNQIAKIDRSGNISIVAQGGALDGPSSLVFGQGKHDKRTLYISSFAIGKALGLVPGIPTPSLDAIPSQVPGQRLP